MIVIDLLLFLFLVSTSCTYREVREEGKRVKKRAIHQSGEIDRLDSPARAKTLVSLVDVVPTAIPAYETAWETEQRESAATCAVGISLATDTHIESESSRLAVRPSVLKEVSCLESSQCQYIGLEWIGIVRSMHVQVSVV
ncbi:hypothetical protein BD289DRAFT_80171 [Coniella lustricola]|uniref:Uncharacterized protein n=1 Tax=Coniella lustricola TaxID=2025994 RepID=A0A2T2ZZ11_9PEZI|nr:hypothetical protein BD289DRAFT_80171 [Coniella lustricola]